MVHVIIHHFLIKAGNVSLCDSPVSSNPKPRETVNAFEDGAVGSLAEGSSRWRQRRLHYKWRLHLSPTKRLNNCTLCIGWEEFSDSLRCRATNTNRHRWAHSQRSMEQEEFHLSEEWIGERRFQILRPRFFEGSRRVSGRPAKNTKDHETRHDMAWNLFWDPRRSNKGKTSTYFWKKMGTKTGAKTERGILWGRAVLSKRSMNYFPKLETSTVKKLYLHCRAWTGTSFEQARARRTPWGNQIRRNGHSITRTRCKLWRETEHELPHRTQRLCIRTPFMVWCTNQQNQRNIGDSRCQSTDVQKMENIGTSAC